MTHYSDAEKELIETLWIQGVSADDIAKRLGRTVRSVYNQAHKMRVRRTAEYKRAQTLKATRRANEISHRTWSDHDLAVLRSLSVNGYGYGDMMRAFPKRTYQGIYQKVLALRKIDATQ